MLHEVNTPLLPRVFLFLNVHQQISGGKKHFMMPRPRLPAVAVTWIIFVVFRLVLVEGVDTNQQTKSNGGYCLVLGRCYCFLAGGGWGWFCTCREAIDDPRIGGDLTRRTFITSHMIVFLGCFGEGNASWLVACECDSNGSCR